MSKIILAEQASAPNTPGSGKVAVYANNATLPALCWKDDAGNVNVAPYTVSGIWTPALAFGGVSTGITYTTQSGTYVRIGSLVYVNFSIELSSKGSATGNATITGLPVTGGTDYDGVVVRFYTNMAGLSGNPFGYIGGTAITLAMASATNRTILTDANFANNSRLDMWGVYSV